MLGIDVYTTPFPDERWWTILRHGANEMLVMRAKWPVTGDTLRRS
ncbi:MAG: hypothetical protein EXS17_06530 [Phycisphaerales bacterium]|nr:hypothetical protein [Phycisphaerales bacterium]